jgi:fructose-1,6-bisphosphatase
MNREELLSLYIEKLHDKTMDIMGDKEEISVLEALKVALEYIEGEMKGY